MLFRGGQSCGADKAAFACGPFHFVRLLRTALVKILFSVKIGQGKTGRFDDVCNHTCTYGIHPYSMVGVRYHAWQQPHRSTNKDRHKIGGASHVVLSKNVLFWSSRALFATEHYGKCKDFGRTMEKYSTTFFHIICICTEHMWNDVTMIT